MPRPRTRPSGSAFVLVDDAAEDIMAADPASTAGCRARFGRLSLLTGHRLRWTAYQKDALLWLSAEPSSWHRRLPTAQIALLCVTGG